MKLSRESAPRSRRSLREEAQTVPRVTYIPTKKKEPEPPVVDPVKGMFLERQNALDLSTKQMAVLCGYGETRFREMLKTTPTWQWKVETVMKLAKGLGIPPGRIFKEYEGSGIYG
nr:MAG TPA: Regulatory protein-modification, helix-turn-helix, transcriptional regulator, DNA [Caudoviricetes sp.]